MTRKLITAALLVTSVLFGAIKKAEDSKSETPPAEKAPGMSSDELLDELRKRADREGGLKLDEANLLDFFRGILAAQGVPAEQLKKMGLPELLRLMREKNPDAFKGPGSGLTPGFDDAVAEKLEEHYRQLLEGHRPGTLEAAKATFVLRDAKKPAEPLAFATGVRSDGWLLTKASEVAPAGGLQCEIHGEWLAAKIVRTWPAHDLALLKVAATDLPAVKWSGRAAPQVGTFVSAVAPAGRDPLAIGIVSVLTRNEQSKGRGFLGVSLTSDEHGLKIREVVPGGAANASGLQKEDHILEMDGKKADSVFTFTKMVSERKAGEKVHLKVQRGNAIVEKDIALGDRGTIPGGGRGGPDKMNSMGSTLSKRRAEFASVMQTDLPLEATQCGGPVTDLDGDVLGIVIARSGRVETMVLPGDTIRQLLATVEFASGENHAAASPEAPRPAAPTPAK